MNRNISVRSLLVDDSTGRLIKAVDERDLSDFLQLLQKKESEKSAVVLFDFSPIVEYFHNELDNKLSQRDNRDLAIKRSTVFNVWQRLKTFTNNDFLCNVSARILHDSEEALNWIHTRLPSLVENYNKSNSNSDNQKTQSLLSLSDEIEVFIEILLCNLHATAKVDIKSLKADFVITEHCNSIQKIVLTALQSECKYYSHGFHFNSLIYQVCMEDMGINPEVLIHLIGSRDRVEDIRQSILKKATTKDEWDGNCYERVRTVTWPKADPQSFERAKILSKLLEKINSLIFLIEELKTSEVSFEDRPEMQEEFNQNIQKLLSNVKN